MANASVFDRYPILSTIPTDKFPRNIFIIPDGNGRWAKQQGLPIAAGHEAGYHVIEQLLEDMSQLQEIRAIGFWGFASDNWRRSKTEVNALMQLFSFVLKKHIQAIKKRNGIFIHIGRKDRLPEKLRQQIEKAEKETANNTGQIIYLALDFGGEDQQIRILEKTRSLPVSTVIDLETLWQFRDGEGRVKSADLLIRTSGEMRTSDIGWISGAPTELYFIDTLFPDISTADIVEAIVAFSKRERRFGARTVISK